MAKARRGVWIWRRTISLGGSSRAMMLKRAVAGTRGRTICAASRISAALSGARGRGASGGAVRQAARTAMRIRRAGRTGFQGIAVRQPILVRKRARGPQEPPERRLQAGLPAPRELNRDLETDGVVAQLLGRERHAQGLFVLGEFELAAVAQGFHAADLAS